MSDDIIVVNGYAVERRDLGNGFGSRFGDGFILYNTGEFIRLGEREVSENPGAGETSNLFHDPDVTQESINNFETHKNTLAAALSDADTIVVTGSPAIAGTSYTVNFSLAEFGDRLASYAFFFNTSLNNPFGQGGSYAAGAVVNPALLSAGDIDEIVVTASYPNSGGNFGVSIWNWFTLHELVHQYLVDAGIDAAFFDQWWTRSEGGSNPNIPWLGSDEFQANERYTNDIVKLIAGKIGVPLPVNPPGGSNGATSPFTATGP